MARKKKPRKKVEITAAQEIRELQQQAEELQQRVHTLSQTQRSLWVQQQVLAGMCDVLQGLRDGTYQGWMQCIQPWTGDLGLEELPLLQDLGVQGACSLSSLATHLGQLHVTTQQPDKQAQQHQQLLLQQHQQQQQQEEAAMVVLVTEEAAAEKEEAGQQHPASSDDGEVCTDTHAAAGAAIVADAVAAPAPAPAPAPAAAAAVMAVTQWQLRQQQARVMLQQQDDFAALETQLTWDLQHQRQAQPLPPPQQQQQTEQPTQAGKSLQHSRSSSCTSAPHATGATASAAQRSAASGPGTGQRNSPQPTGDSNTQQLRVTPPAAAAGRPNPAVPAAAGAAAAAAAVDGAPGPTGVAPALPAATQPVQLTEAGGYLGTLTHVFSQPPWPGAADMTLQHFAEYYSAYVRDLALHVALADQQAPQFEWPTPAAGQEAQARAEAPSSAHSAPLLQQQQQEDGVAHPLLTLREVQLKHAQLIVSLMMLHPGDLLPRLRTSNLRTLKLSDGDNQAWQRTHWLLDQLQLRSDQQEALIAGSSLFKQLVGRLLADRQELLRQQDAQAALRLPTGRAVDLAAQSALAQRLQVLVKKELFLVTCASAFATGVLDVVQQARCCVLMWPYVPQLMMLGPVLLEKVQLQAQQEKEQQQQRRRLPEQQQGLGPGQGQGQQVG